MTIGGTGTIEEKHIIELLKDSGCDAYTFKDAKDIPEFRDYINEKYKHDYYSQNFCDGLMKYDNIIIKIEVKNSSNMNQIRPRYFDVVVADVRKEDGKYRDIDFVVYPPNYMVWKYTKNRGQSIPDGMGSSNGKVKIDEIEMFGCTYSELKDKIIQAFLIGENDVDSKEFARERRRLHIELYEENIKWNKENYGDEINWERFI